MNKCDRDYPKSTDAIKIKNFKNKRVCYYSYQLISLKYED